jgi:hypothetical protein
MAQRETVDNIIRSALRTEVRSAEPSAAVRESLLAAAASEKTLRSALGPSVPPLAEDLLEVSEPAADWGVPIATAIPLARRQLLLLAAPLHAVR